MEKKWKIAYSAPVMIMLKLKLVRLPVFEAAVSVSIAEIDWLGSRIVFCRFQVRLSTELAVVGTQLPVVIVSVSGSVHTRATGAPKGNCKLYV